MQQCRDSWGRIGPILAILVLNLLISCSAKRTAEGGDLAGTEPLASPTIWNGSYLEEPPNIEGWSSCGVGIDCTRILSALVVGHEKRTVDIEVARKRATVQPARGTILLHPGGPGLRAADMISEGFSLSDSIADSFDQVAWNARGVAGADELACSGIEWDYARSDHASLDSFPKDDVALRLASCAAEASEMVRTVDSASQIADIDAVLAALPSAPLAAPHGSPVHLVGFSYGTYVFTAYAAARPERVTSMVMDGIVSWHDGYRKSLVEQAKAVQNLVDSHFGECSNCAPDTLTASLSAARAGELQTGTMTMQPGDVIHALFSGLYNDFDAMGMSRLFDPSADAMFVYRAAKNYRTDLIYGATLFTSCAELGYDPQITVLASAAANEGRMWEAAVLGEYRVCDLLEKISEVDAVRDTVITVPTMIVASDDVITPFDPSIVKGRFSDVSVVTTDRRGHTSWSFSLCVRDSTFTFLVEGTHPPSTCVLGP